MNVMPLKGHVLFKPIKKIVYSQNRIPLRKILLYSFYNIYVLVNRYVINPCHRARSVATLPATGYWRLFYSSRRDQRYIHGLIMIICFMLHFNPQYFSVALFVNCPFKLIKSSIFYGVQFCYFYIEYEYQLLMQLCFHTCRVKVWNIYSYLFKIICNITAST